MNCDPGSDLHHEAENRLLEYRGMAQPHQRSHATRTPKYGAPHHTQQQGNHKMHTRFRFLQL
jgi:hypothetical protein